MYPLGLLWFVDPIKSEDAGKVQTRFVERAVGVVKGEILGSWAREHEEEREKNGMEQKP